MAALPDAPLAGLVLGAFSLGIASGVHCIGMCGGLVAAFSSQRSVVRLARDPGDLKPRAALLAFFNAGRIGAYTLAGAVAGAMGGAGAYAAGVIDLQVALYVLANLMLVAMGLYLAGLSPVLAKLEAFGGPAWHYLRPLATHFLPADTPLRSLVAGGLWGWVPCGLVYGMLVAALAAGSASRGAMAMLAFGLGTVPNLMLAGIAFSRAHRFAARPWVRRLAGGLVLAFGLAGLARATDLSAGTLGALFCL